MRTPAIHSSNTSANVLSGFVVSSNFCSSSTFFAFTRKIEKIRANALTKSVLRERKRERDGNENLFFIMASLVIAHKSSAGLPCLVQVSDDIISRVVEG